MSKIIHQLQKSVKGTLSVPGDKSMSHRAVIFGALSEGETTIHNFLLGEDCISTIEAFRALGVSIEIRDKEIFIKGNGLRGLTEPLYPIDFGNSGTTARLMLGVLAGQPFHTVLIGDDSLSKRPMERVTNPVQQMGAHTDGRADGKYLPMSIRGGKLTPIQYKLPVNSAQVKSAILLAGLFADGTTTVIEPVPTRDHTERMIKAFGGEVTKKGTHISIEGDQVLSGCQVDIPGDISSAAFFIVAAAITPNSYLIIENVGLNPTRTGIIDVLKQMGASIETTVTNHLGDEPVGTIKVQTSSLSGVEISGSIIPRVIDEIPLIALLATQAEGTTVIRDAEDLRYKETDRIKAVVDVLTKLGAHIEEQKDGMIIHGKKELRGNKVSSYGDHRIGMMLAIASFLTKEEVEIENPECINISYPTFFEDLEKITQN